MRYIKRILDISHDLERKSQFLFGPRQTGKTSWIREELDGVRYHFNLLDKKLVKALENDPALFAGMLRREGIDSGLVVVDEIQKLPFLLDEVHNLIESTDIRFLLTGSSARRLREHGTNLLGAGPAERRCSLSFGLKSRAMREALIQFSGQDLSLPCIFQMIRTPISSIMYNSI